MASTTIVDNQALRRFRSAARMLFLAYATKQHFDGHHDCAHELVLDTFLQMCKERGDGHRMFFRSLGFDFERVHETASPV
ncbi:hypothetical protein Pmar_PMAR004450 [Perkinsus marinus ATCC 50983]|uniref:Uncharacterized protein n=1 Tax=Perkinsus marinus (strain ATCC 50983 / TXsc) TaxID=423536 RepID=C5LZP5_PERM5|nr:hypothetical protein Pmar_PMAR004450 [Perkinsus marinus ATCC 50983]EEQ97713.1 hypothetical protein Pmar_PMAR004450 [Perkinsus marinus ATCC 50983]|eukprot:XP_002764996.1 hypothetical protein Pmar_PMAR004450 [Perkinsus marinus ATCC 50983]